jgi:hypothetical protein
LAAGSNDPWVIDRALYAAECQIHLERVKLATAAAFRSLADPNDRAQFVAGLQLLKRLEPYQRKARSRWKKAIRELHSLTAHRSASGSF